MEAPTQKLLHFSDSVVVSCGTVTVDTQKRKVLLIKWRKDGNLYLPKGRKDIGESLGDAAARETYEETGFHCALRPTACHTKQTFPKHDGAISPVKHTEPFAVSQRQTAGAWKIIFWFVGEADSMQVPDQDTQENDEDFETCWVTFESAKTILAFEDDRSICTRGIELAEGDAEEAIASAESQR